MYFESNLIYIFNTKIPIYDLVVKNGIELKKQGKNFMGLCPFHSEKTPSFSVSIEKNIALCMACNKGGKPVTFYSQLKDITLEKSLQELSQIFNLKLPKNKIFYQNPLYEILELANDYYQKSLSFVLERKEYNDHPLKKYLFQTRELNLGLIKEFGLGYAYNDNNSLKKYLLQKNSKIKDLLKLGLLNDYNTDFFRDRVMIPLKNSEGLIVGFCGRLYQYIPEKTKQPKYLFNIQNSLFKKDELLYRLFEHQNDIQEKKEVFLCEGFFDVISFYKIGIKNVIAVLGTNLNLKQIRMLQKITKKIIIVFDGDNAGQEATKKIAKLLDNFFEVKILNLPLELDPDQFILNNKSNISDISFLKKIEEMIKIYYSGSIPEITSKLSKESKNSLKVSNTIIKDFLIEVFFNSIINLKFIIEKSRDYTIIEPDIIELIRIFKEYREQELMNIQNNLIQEEQNKEINEINIFNFKKDCKINLDKLNPKIYDLLSQVENDEKFKYKKRIENTNPEYLDSLFYSFFLQEKKEKEKQILKQKLLSLKINLKKEED